MIRKSARGASTDGCVAEVHRAIEFAWMGKLGCDWGYVDDFRQTSPREFDVPVGRGGCSERSDASLRQAEAVHDVGTTSQG